MVRIAKPQPVIKMQSVWLRPSLVLVQYAGELMGEMFALSIQTWVPGYAVA